MGQGQDFGFVLDSFFNFLKGAKVFLFLLLLFLFGGFSHQVAAATIETTFADSSSPQDDCPYGDSGDPDKYLTRTIVWMKVTSNNNDDYKKKVKLIVECRDTKNQSEYYHIFDGEAPQAYYDDQNKEHVKNLGKGYYAGYYIDTAVPEFTKDGKTNKNGRHENGNGKYDVVTGDNCRVKAFLAGDNAPSNAQGDFIIGYKHKEAQPASVVGGSIEVGKEFSLGTFLVSPLGETSFSDVLLRECKASADPWIFWSNNNTLHRVYPTETNSTQTIPHTVKAGHNDPPLNKYDNANCLRMYDAVINNLFTIGADYTDCQVRVGAYDASGGSSFTAQGDPTLANDAAVTLSNGKVMVRTGAKPDAPPDISSDIEVYISTNRGFTWTKSSLITQWTDQADDSGVDAAQGNNDNTRNMAVLRITTGLGVWWRIIKGQ